MDKLQIINQKKGIHHSSKRAKRPTTDCRLLTAGFTLIELMVVIAIISLLVTIMIPNVRRYIEKGKEAKAKADIDVLTKQINLFHADQGRYPSSLQELLNPPDPSYGPYISDPEISKTPWNTAYEYKLEANSYTIIAKDDKGNVRAQKTINF